MMSILTDYYNLWIDAGKKLWDSVGYHTMPDGTIKYINAQPYFHLYSPAGFWIVHIAGILTVCIIIYMLKTKMKVLFKDE